MSRLMRDLGILILLTFSPLLQTGGNPQCEITTVTESYGDLWVETFINSRRGGSPTNETKCRKWIFDKPKASNKRWIFHLRMAYVINLQHVTMPDGTRFRLPNSRRDLLRPLDFYYDVTGACAAAGIYDVTKSISRVDDYTLTMTSSGMTRLYAFYEFICCHPAAEVCHDDDDDDDYGGHYGLVVALLSVLLAIAVLLCAIFTGKWSRLRRKCRPDISFPHVGAHTTVTTCTESTDTTQQHEGGDYVTIGTRRHHHHYDNVTVVGEGLLVDNFIYNM